MKTRSSRLNRIILGFVTAAALLGPAVVPAHAADEQVIITTKIYPTQGREDELQARLIRSVELVKKAEPDFTYRLHRSVKEPVVFLFYEIYPSQAAFDRHRTETLEAVRKEMGPPPEGILARPPETEFFRILVN